MTRKAAPDRYLPAGNAPGTISERSAALPRGGTRKFPNIRVLILMERTSEQIFYSPCLSPACAYTHCSTESTRFSIGVTEVIAIKRQHSVPKLCFSDSYSASHALHRNPYLSALRDNSCSDNYAHPQRTGFALQRSAVLQRNRTEAITTLSVLLYRAESRQFSALRHAKAGGTQPKSSAIRFVIPSCLADADRVAFSNHCLISTRQRRRFSRLSAEAGAVFCIDSHWFRNASGNRVGADLCVRP